MMVIYCMCADLLWALRQHEDAQCAMNDASELQFEVLTDNTHPRSYSGVGVAR